MYLSHVSLTPAALNDRGVQAALGRGAYGHHQLLCKLFGSTRGSNFQFRHLDGEPGIHFYTLGRAEPEVSDDAYWACSSKPFQPILREGQRLVFSVRINPTINRSEGARDGGSGKPRKNRRDLIYEAVREQRALGNRTPSRNLIAQECGERWLETRFQKFGFVLDRRPNDEPEKSRVAVICLGYRQHRVKKGTQQITVSTLDCEGVGTVTDPTTFTTLLQSGLGPAKGFGCGLMLIKPA
jgi:CRISPR system Cascade subunit CasE